MRPVQLSSGGKLQKTLSFPFPFDIKIRTTKFAARLVGKQNILSNNEMIMNFFSNIYC
jgi:hypothetical protein